MPSNPTIVAAVIGGAATVLAACITVSASGYRLTSTSDTRDFEKAKQENTRLVQESAGLKEENGGLWQENEGLKRQITSLHAQLTNSTACTTPQSQDSAPQDSPVENRTDNFACRRPQCVKSSGKVTCVVKLTSTKEDRTVWLSNQMASIIDSKGNEQKTIASKIGGATSSPFGISITTLPANVPVKLSLTFGGVDSDVNRLSILTINVRSQVGNGALENEEFQFRNISLQ